MNLNCDLDKVKYFGNTAQLRYYLAVEVWLGKLLNFDMFFFNTKKIKKIVINSNLMSWIFMVETNAF